MNNTTGDLTYGFLDMLTNITLHQCGYVSNIRNHYNNYEVARFDEKNVIKLGYEKDTEPYIYGDYGKAYENKGDLFKIGTVPNNININPVRIKGLNRYRIIKKTNQNYETFFTILLYQKYKKKARIKFNTLVNITTILKRDNIIDTILDEN